MLDVEKLLKAIDLPELVEREAGQAKLHRVNGSFRAACPIHGGDNRTAFSVWETDEGYHLWKCHTRCGSSGNAIHFIQRMKNLEWFEAFKYLADYAHLPLAELGMTEEAVREHRERERRSDVLELAARFYQGRAERIAEYAQGRGFSAETIAVAGFGHSDGDGLRAWLQAQHGDLTLARESGLLRADGLDFTANGDGRTASPDGWLIYVHREGGRVAYLSARALNPVDPKDKSRNLPGAKQLYRADVKGDRGVILCEGQADAESLRQLGRTGWALCGQAELTPQDLAAVRRRKPVYLALDNDPAPEQRETNRQRRQSLANQIGPLAMIVPALPEGLKDLNDWLQAGATDARLGQCLDRSQPWIDLAIETAKGVPAYELDAKIGEVAGLIAGLPESMQGRYLKQAETALGVPVKDLRQRMKNPDVNGNGLAFAQVKDGRLSTLGGQPLINLNATITHELSMEDGLNPPLVRYTISGTLDNGRALRPLEIPADQFPAAKWLHHWGADAFINVPPNQEWMIPRAIQHLSRGVMKKEHVYTYTGWGKVDGRRAFLTNSGAISADGFDPNVRVKLDDPLLAMYALPAPPEDARAAMQASLEFLELAPYTVTLPIWAAMYAAPLGEIRTLYSVLWVYGITQSLKSTLTMLALCHFGQDFIHGREYRAPKDWMSTITDLEGAMFALKDVPIVIDDYAPQDSTADIREMTRNAHRVIRSVGNRSARGRANHDLTTRTPRPPRGLVIATAEKLIGGVQSISGRTLSVLIKKGDVVLPDGGNDGLDRAQRAAGKGGPGLYGQAMSAYIRWLCKHWDRIAAELPAEYEAANQHARSVLPRTWNRLMDYYATLITGARTGLRFALRVGAITERQHQALAQDALPAALLEVIRLQDKLTNQQSPIRRFVEALSDLIAQDLAYLDPRTDDTPAPPSMTAKRLGWFDRDTPAVYLLPGPSLMMARDYWQRMGEGFDVSKEYLFREIDQAGLVFKRGKEELTISKWINTKLGNHRVLAVNDDLVEQQFGVGLRPATHLGTHVNEVE